MQDMHNIVKNTGVGKYFSLNLNKIQFSSTLVSVQREMR